ncbi:hypothetical protein EDB81DRAFT_767917 [Dactylonectria macrodidyma]|uniref:Uncharacterized protein n=1 Tax=Dactylonectria macrodidyma TaxID=307937 RepID=A0A9P9D7C5_9HYPO|nr:hypothetical protein EDB81DRAFT_767917 [Dactylonectria macrodidyma]
MTQQTIQFEAIANSVCCSFSNTRISSQAPANTDARLDSLHSDPLESPAEVRLLKGSKEAWIAYRVAVEEGRVKPEEFEKLSCTEVDNLVAMTNGILERSTITTLTSQTFLLSDRARQRTSRSERYNSILGIPVSTELPPSRSRHKRKRGDPVVTNTQESHQSPSLAIVFPTMRETQVPRATADAAIDDQREPASSNDIQAPNSNPTLNSMTGDLNTVVRDMRPQWDPFEGCRAVWPPAKHLQHVFPPPLCRDIIQLNAFASIGLQWTPEAAESRFSFHLKDKADSDLAFELYGVHIDIIDAGLPTSCRAVSFMNGSVAKIRQGSQIEFKQAKTEPIKGRIGDLVDNAVNGCKRRSLEDNAGGALTDCVVLNIFGDPSQFTRVDVISDMPLIYEISKWLWTNEPVA